MGVLKNNIFEILLRMYRINTQHFNLIKNTLMTTIYDFNVKTLQWKEISLRDFEWKTILVVNTASKCGLTPQYEWLEKLYEKYKDKNFVILGFPCNQFAEQEPGDAKTISEGCLINYWVTFPMFEKIDINWENAHPLYKYLREEKKADAENPKTAGLVEQTKWLRKIFDETDIVWNFGKFLINKDGKVIERYSPMTTPEELESIIEEVL